MCSIKIEDRFKVGHEGLIHVIAKPVLEASDSTMSLKHETVRSMFDITHESCHHELLCHIDWRPHESFYLVSNIT